MEVNPIKLHGGEHIEANADADANTNTNAPAISSLENETVQNDQAPEDNHEEIEVNQEVNTNEPEPEPKPTVTFDEQPQVIEQPEIEVEPELYADKTEPADNENDNTTNADDYDPESAFSKPEAAIDSKEDQNDDEPYNPEVQNNEQNEDDSYDPEAQTKQQEKENDNHDDDDEDDDGNYEPEFPSKTPVEEEKHVTPSSSSLPKTPLFAGLPPKPPVNATVKPSTSAITDESNTKQLLQDAYDAYVNSSLSRDPQFLSLEANEKVDKIKEFLISQGIDLSEGPNPVNFDQVYSYNKPFKNLKEPIPLVPVGDYCRRPNITAPMNALEEKEYNEFIERENYYLNLQNWDEFPDKLRLFIGNLPANTISKQDLFRIFSQYGEVIQIAIKAGYGFTQFRTSEACLNCIRGELDVPLHNKILRLDASRPQKSRRPGHPEINNPNMSSSGRERVESDDSGPSRKKKRGSFDCKVFITGKSSVFFIRKVKKAFAGLQISIDVEDVTQKNISDVLSEAAYSGVLAACVIKELKVDVQTFEEAPDGGIKFDEYADVDPDEAANIVNKAKVKKYGNNMPQYHPQDSGFSERSNDSQGYSSRGGRGGHRNDRRGGHKGRGGGRGNNHGHGHGHGYGNGYGGRGGGGYGGPNDYGYGGRGGNGGPGRNSGGYDSWNQSPQQQPYGLVTNPPQLQAPYGQQLQQPPPPQQQQQFYGQQQLQSYGSPPQQASFNQWNSPPQQQQRIPNANNLQQILLSLAPVQVQGMINMLSQQAGGAGGAGSFGHQAPPPQNNNYGGYSNNYGSNGLPPPPAPQQQQQPQQGGSPSTNQVNSLLAQLQRVSGNNNNNSYGQPPQNHNSSFYDQLSRRANR